MMGRAPGVNLWFSKSQHSGWAWSVAAVKVPPLLVDTIRQEGLKRHGSSVITKAIAWALF